ncbi:DNA mismatch repair protein MutS [Acidobacteriota bacterium]
MAKKNETTPMMEQYHRIKAKHKDALLLYRLGDFYEMFFMDAKIAAPVLEIALTSRHKVPMCGVPHHAVDSYLVKLLKNGYKVAICEQTGDPKLSKGIVERDVVKILTPGTAVEIELEEAKENIYVSSLYLVDGGWGMAAVDLASGQMKTAQSYSQEQRLLSDELFKISPREIIFPEGQQDQIVKILTKNDLPTALQSPREDWTFDFTQSKNLLQEHFGVKSLAGFDLADKELAVSAAGALLLYIQQLRKDSLSLIHSISYLPSDLSLILDSTSIKNLELVKNLRDGGVKGSLLDVIDFTVTSLGGRLLKSWLLQPSQNLLEIEERLDSVEEFLNKIIERQKIREELKGIYDLERLTGKISLGVAHARDLVSLKTSLLPLPLLHSQLDSIQAKKVKRIYREWDNAEDIVGLIDSAIMDEPAFLLTDGGIIKEGFSSELDDLRKISHSGKSYISGLEKKERERTGISSLKIRYNRVFGYYIDVTKPNLSQVPEDYIRKQTLVNSERFITPELKEYEEKVLNAEERIGEIEHKLFLEVRGKISKEFLRLQKIASFIAILDVLVSLAEGASQRNYCRPRLQDTDTIQIREGRHPVIELTNEDPFIPNDTFLNRDGEQILIITGPNMGGKSTYLRQVALICILAHMGSFVPAESADISLVDRIFTRIGAMDFLSVGQSTFMVEMLETANILNNATSKSLILLDEIGRGTSTFDGLSIAWAVTEYLHEKEGLRAKTLFATHYHELTELEMIHDRVKNFHISVKEWEENIIFLRKIIPGPSDQSYGIHVAKLAGIPKRVVNRAKEILFNLEKQELDDLGHPKIAYHPSKKQDKSQGLLFQTDVDSRILDEIREVINQTDISKITPLEALNLLNAMREKIKDSRR